MSSAGGFEPTPVTIAFGRRVREMRRASGLSLRVLGACALLDAATLSRVENGGDTTLSAAERIAAALGSPLPPMLVPDSCGHCLGSPPAGFTCQACGLPGPEVTR